MVRNATGNVGERFIAEVEKAYNRLKKDPEIYAKIDGDKVFLYSVFYTVEIRRKSSNAKTALYYKSMETTIKLHPTELTLDLIERLKLFAANQDDLELVISLKKKDTSYETRLNESITHYENGGEMHTFTFDEFMAYTSGK